MYTKSVMNSAAAETARAAKTYQDTDALKEFAKRRLMAVPEISIFHVGGASDWDISIGQSSEDISVEISGHLRPIPLIGALTKAFYETDQNGLVLHASVIEQIYPSWVGGNYGGWQTIWG